MLNQLIIRTLIALSLLALPGAPSNARAGEISPFRLSGYGTLACTADDRNDVAPIRDFSQKPDDGHKTDNATWKLDSRLGLQAHYRLSDEVDFLLQGVLRDQVKIDMRNSIELAYAAYKPRADLELRAGRLGYDAFLMSDTRNIGYANLWVRPPTEFYAWIPIFSVDGLDATFRIDTRSAQWRIKAQYGSSYATFPMGEVEYDVETNNLFSLTVERQSGPFRIKAGYSRLSLENEADAFAPLFGGLDAFAAATRNAFPEMASEAEFISRNLSFKNNRIEYLSLGAVFDNGDWVAQAEVAHSSSDSDAVAHGNMAYFSLGRRIGDWTPYFLFSFIHPTEKPYSPETNWDLVGQGAFQDQAVYLMNSMRAEQRTFSLGIRWDFHNQAALKFQWDHSRVKPYYGLWFRSLDASERAGSINMWTLGLEFMF